MKLEDQVCTLEQAKRLQELGIETESLFEWVEFEEDDAPEINLIDRRYSRPNIHAYTVAELGEMLPDALKVNNGESIINTQSKHFNNSEWIYSYRFQETGEIAIAAQILPTEAQVRADMLILLLENGYEPYNQLKP